MDITDGMNFSCGNLTNGFINCTNITEAEPLPHWYVPLEKAHRIILTIILVLTMMAMGCTVEIPVVIKHLKRPWPIMVGALCQFLILPALAFGLVNALKMETLYALGCVILSCSPGGGTSNLFTYWVDGDVSLSIVMTVVSTVLAFVLMPLNIFIYTRFWVAELAESAITGSPFTVIPYDKLFIALASTLGPAIVGVIIRRWSVKVADILATVGSVIGLINIWAVITMQTYLYEWHKQSMWEMWVSSLVLPSIGFLSGFCLSKLLCQRIPIPRTVAFETGSQNVALALSVIALSFPTAIVKKVIIFPTLYGVFMLVTGFIPVTIYRIYRCFRPLKKEEEEEEGDLEKPALDKSTPTAGHDNKSFIKENCMEQNGKIKNVIAQNGTIQNGPTKAYINGVMNEIECATRL